MSGAVVCERPFRVFCFACLLFPYVRRIMRRLLGRTLGYGLAMQPEALGMIQAGVRHNAALVDAAAVPYTG